MHAGGQRVDCAQKLGDALESAALLDTIGGLMVALADVSLPVDRGLAAVRRRRTARPRMASVLPSGRTAAQLEQVARELPVEAWAAEPPGFSALEGARETALAARFGAASGHEARARPSK